MKIAEKLQLAKAYLNSETWHQGRFFQVELEAQKVCLCAHAACGVASCGLIRLYYDRAVAEVKSKLIVHGGCNQMSALAGYAHLDAAAWEGYRTFQSLYSYEVAWARRPSWINSENETSYVLGMVGLTTHYNDTHTLEEVLCKFNQAINVAEVLDF